MALLRSDILQVFSRVYETAPGVLGFAKLACMHSRMRWSTTFLVEDRYPQVQHFVAAVFKQNRVASYTSRFDKQGRNKREGHCRSNASRDFSMPARSLLGIFATAYNVLQFEMAQSLSANLGHLMLAKTLLPILHFWTRPKVCLFRSMMACLFRKATLVDTEF